MNKCKISCVQQKLQKKLLEDLKEDLSTWKSILFMDYKGAERSMLPKFVYSNNAIPLKSQMVSL